MSGRNLKWSSILAVTCLLLIGCAVLGLRTCRRDGGPPAELPAAQAEARDPRWAMPVARAGVPNLHKVSEDLYRGGQPTAEGFRALRAMGIRTVVNLRSFHSDRDEMGDAGFRYEHITMKAWHPEDKEVTRFLRIVADPENTPVFVHCQHGADRTGVMSAAYRIAVQGWSVEEAVQEMVRGGYGFHDVWRGALGGYLRELDFGTIRRDAGLSDAVGPGGRAPAPG